MYDLEKIFTTISNGKIIPSDKINVIHGEFDKKTFSKKVKEINMGNKLDIAYLDDDSFKSKKIQKLNDHDLLVIDELYGNEKNIKKLKDISSKIIIFTQLLPLFTNYDIINPPKINNVIYSIVEGKNGVKYDDLELSILLSSPDDIIEIKEKKSKDICNQLLEMYDLINNTEFINYKELKKKDRIDIYKKIMEKIENQEFNLDFKLDFKDDSKNNYSKLFLEYLDLELSDVDDSINIFIIPELDIFDEMFSLEKDFINKKSKNNIINDIAIITNNHKLNTKEKKLQSEIIKNYEGIKFISSTNKKEKVGDKFGFIRGKKIMVFEILGITPFSRRNKRKGWKEKEHKDKNILFLSPDYFELKLKEFKKTYSVKKIKPFQQFNFDL